MFRLQKLHIWMGLHLLILPGKQTNEDMPVVLFFTKIDKKVEKDVDIILKSAAKLCKKELKNMPVDTIGVSCNNGVSMKFLNNRSIEEVFKKIRTTTGTTDYLQLAENQIQSWFEEEITWSNNIADEYEEDRQNSIKDKQKLQSDYNDIKKISKENLDDLREALLIHYDEFLEKLDNCSDAFDEALDGWIDSIRRENEWRDKAGFFNDISSLIRQRENSLNQCKTVINRDFSYKDPFKREYREYLCDEVEKHFNYLLNEIHQYREEQEKKVKDLVQDLQSEAELRELINKYQPIVLQTLQRCYTACKKMIIDHIPR